ncbi:MAG: phosphotransferase family protein, partial [Pseudomonadales bacterium]
YCELRGISLPENWSFYVAFSFFRLAAILQGVLYRTQSGNASNPAGLDIMKSAVKDLAEAAKTATRGD